MTWKDRLAGKLPAPLAEEIDVFATQIELRKQGKLDEVIFNETRLRRGIYGQRYDNGQRHDGIEARSLDYPSGELMKGPGTRWDAPGMQRIKIPFGQMSPEQMEMLAACAEDHADGICHITTRQDIQLHFVHIDDTPDLMRRLASVGITTREACGNTVRNVTACPYAGVCTTETFDVTPYAKSLAYFLLGHPDAQDFGRKFKVAFSGCAHEACGLVTIHDLGFVAKVQDGKRGFELYVGGGLGSVPYTAQLFDAFLPEDEVLPMAQAICRVFARLGEKRNRARARLKFVVRKLGIDEFKRVVLEERAALRPDPRWASDREEVETWREEPLKPASSLVRRGGDFEAWRSTNVRPQKQAGYSAVTVRCPLGDLSATQMRALAGIARRYLRGTLRTTVEQNVVLRWVSDADLEPLYRELCTLGLGASGAGTIVDVVACPGTDTCKLGIASSRGLGAVLGERLAARGMMHDEAVGPLRIKVSGCFNSCGQHHIADIGFYGVSRKVGAHTVPHFQAMLGGQWTENAKSYGMAMGAIPSRNVPEAVDRLVDSFVKNRTEGESYQEFIGRVGKLAVRKLLEDLFEVPAYDADPSFYRDWGDVREFSIGDMGVGECAGEVVSVVQFGLAAAEREVFEAMVLFEKGDLAGAGQKGYAAMHSAAKALTRQLHPDLGDEPDEVASEFKTRLVDEKLFWDPFAGAKFAHYFFLAHVHRGETLDREGARQLLEEASLFIEAAHSCYQKMSAPAAS
jgi:sulfite reductase (ferredoxin)